jgi:hypothetical protein
MKPTDFSIHVTSFLSHYLAAQRNLRPNTIKAYRDVFTLLLRFCRDVRGIAPEKLRRVREIIGLPLCTHSSDMFRPKSRPTWFNARESSRFPYGGTLAQRSDTFPKTNWLRFWHSPI